MSERNQKLAKSERNYRKTVIRLYQTPSVVFIYDDGIKCNTKKATPFKICDKFMKCKQKYRKLGEFTFRKPILFKLATFHNCLILDHEKDKMLPGGSKTNLTNKLI